MILTPDRRLRIFISSTLDLVEERAAARGAVQSLGLAPVMFEAGARPHPPRPLYQAYVEQSDVFVAIYARRYGWTAPGMAISGLEDEFELSGGMPRLVYLAADVEREARLEAFLGRVRESGLSYRAFSSPAELGSVLRDDLVALLTERFHDPGGPDDRRLGVASAGRAPPAQLPAAPTRLVGRQGVVTDIAALLVRDDVRLVTLLGPGGVGKTRVGIAVAEQAASAFPGGTPFVSLAALADPAGVGEAIASALGVTAADEAGPVRAVADALAGRSTLLVLDNFEQVLPAATVIADLLASTPQLTLLVTSRAPLRVRGEHQMPVDPLDERPAVELFVDAAHAVRPSFELDGAATTAAVADICQAVDGLPLAIELAAAMLRVLTVQQVAERLCSRLPELPGAARDMPERHRTLRATVEWSVALLDAPVRQTFARLGAFRGGFRLQDAEVVCAAEDTFDHVAALVEHSLVRADLTAVAGPRFTMLSTIQRFAEERLGDSPDRDAVLARHATLFAALARAVGDPGGRGRLELVDAELDNVRAALGLLLDAGRHGEVAQAVGGSWWFWWTRGLVAEGRRWADRALAAPDLGADQRARGLLARGMLGLWSGEYELALPMLREAGNLAAATGDRRGVALAVIGTGLVMALSSSPQEGMALIGRGTAEFRALADDEGVTTGLVAHAWVHGVTRDLADAEDVLRDAHDAALRSGSPVDLGLSEAALAQLHLERGEHARAADALRASISQLATARHMGSTILTIELIAELALAAGAAGEAVVLLGAAAAVRQEMGTRLPPSAAQRIAALGTESELATGAEAPRLREQGAALGYTAAVERAQAVLDQLGG